jgi:ketosteroid isomerase-like protein
MVALIGCATTSSDRSLDSGARSRSRVDRDRYVWIDASCSDGAIDLAATGFERTVELEKRGKAMLLTFDTSLATEGCRTTSVWTAEPDAKLYLYQLRPEAWVSWPMRNADPQAKTAVCGAEERTAVPGEIHIAGDTLEIVAQRSPWCRGFDAHFIYRSALVARYVAHFSRGDAAALAGLFEDHGALIESFSASADGQPTRHEGRAAIQAYFERAFAGASWHAARLLAFSQGDDENVIIADLEYIDSELQEPLRVRASFVLAGGEIYESDTQLITDPKPAAGGTAGAAGAVAVEPKS